MSGIRLIKVTRNGIEQVMAVREDLVPEPPAVDVEALARIVQPISRPWWWPFNHQVLPDHLYGDDCEYTADGKCTTHAGWMPTEVPPA